MKKLGGILATLFGAGLAAGGIFALAKSKKEDDYVEIDSCDACEVIEFDSVENSEEE